jgi:hypothetical protein
VLQEVYVNDRLISKSGGRTSTNSYYKQFDYGIVALIGYDIKINKKLSASMQVIYTIGLTDVNQPTISKGRKSTLEILCGIKMNRSRY